MLHHVPPSSELPIAIYDLYKVLNGDMVIFGDVGIVFPKQLNLKCNRYICTNESNNFIFLTF